ncbi:nicotinate-nucleotide adenylyltransferase [Brevibacillus dissolubilis]|uniref:nicotinate-nucleotide adenylyltransferase n=1 Tax=Brevibacillus dissolubilis TaxID=1844116 RepID=UPI00111788E7|nr:nicotinate-nucleotide adenylyltransferase [Brevibacillus dissolubilis]
MTRKKIGIMGGTFDPIHNAHLLAAEQARDAVGLDEVWFMPANIPPHKQRPDIADTHHRLRMTELATQDHPQFTVTDIELTREGKSYTVDTMQQLVDTYPDYDFFFIIGGDMIAILPKWYRFDHLSTLVRFIGLMRPGSVYDKEALSAYVTFVENPVWELSSSLIRENVRTGKSLRYLVPPTVECYIKENRLYEHFA